MVMCGVLSLLGLLSAVTAFAAEATRIKVSLSLPLSLLSSCFCPSQYFLGFIFSSSAEFVVFFS